MNARFTTQGAQRVEDVRSVVQVESRPRESEQSVAEEVLERLARAGRFRDEETAEHVERMSRSCGLIARALGWDASASSNLRAASAMHDIGKVGVPDAVLRKPGPLTPDERIQIEAHAQIGHDILAGSEDEVLTLAATVALTHHEAWDGTGYPRRLAGKEIPQAGRVAAVADMFDALTHDRVYRQAYSVDEAVGRLRRDSGTRFDPDVVEAFVEILPEVEQVRRLYPDKEQAAPLFAAPETGGTLTAREREVTQLLASGLTGEDIAASLFLSSETVRTHVRNAMQRMNAKTRAHLIALAAQHGEISLDEKPPV